MKSFPWGMQIRLSASSIQSKVPYLCSLFFKSTHGFQHYGDKLYKLHDFPVWILSICPSRFTFYTSFCSRRLDCSNNINWLLWPLASHWVWPMASIRRRLEGGRRVRLRYLFPCLPPSAVTRRVVSFTKAVTLVTWLSACVFNTTLPFHSFMSGCGN